MSMDCPLCAGSAGCVDSRRHAGYVKRRYVCKKCKVCFHTLEAVVAIRIKSNDRKITSKKRKCELAKQILESQHIGAR